ncbi:hypothetical protein K492DRAFT_202699 [Lichtheimia hyalospora FSU 10163]|uniref:Uncharacterized protein n=1 Tax=Lichtheimia ornata TaxID=688661 RepID=A0AAD7Y2D0_9FUNG|nr:uncharacterized protein O0I10_001427 [Lichtheimia ornata]KAI7887071.1 hypothetical protein K492DRAFT_202699 [Lichtheimia hyalospora FSU 10163]KAJ8662468.1 hypothetical protein O0I10_001427 [Lichtheimia ornata]
MARFGQAFAVSMGALIGGAFGFYLLEDYKIKAKEQRLAMLLEKKREYEQQQQQESI